jgi:hypothetical protein
MALYPLRKDWSHHKMSGLNSVASKDHGGKVLASPWTAITLKIAEKLARRQCIITEMHYRRQNNVVIATGYNMILPPHFFGEQ